MLAKTKRPGEKDSALFAGVGSFFRGALVGLLVAVPVRNAELPV